MFVNDCIHKKESRIQILVPRKGIELGIVQVIKSRQINKKEEDTITYLVKFKIYVVLCSSKGWSFNSIYIWIIILLFHCASLCFLSKNK